MFIFKCCCVVKLHLFFSRSFVVLHLCIAWSSQVLGKQYCIRHIFREFNFSRIGTSRHFREQLNSRSRKRAMDGEIIIIYSYYFQKAKLAIMTCTCNVYCTTMYIAYTSRIHASGQIGGKYFCVLLNSQISSDSWNSRKSKPREIYGVYSICLIYTMKKTVMIRKYATECELQNTTSPNLIIWHICKCSRSADLTLNMPKSQICTT